MLNSRSYEYNFEIETILQQFIAIIDNAIVMRYSKNSETGERELEEVIKPGYILGTKQRIMLDIINKAKNYEQIKSNVMSELKKEFRYSIKHYGGMLAKGRLLGVQFLELFKDGLYFEISAHAIRLANMLKDGLTELGYKFYADSKTNQQFVIVPNAKLKELDEELDKEYKNVFIVEPTCLLE